MAESFFDKYTSVHGDVPPPPEGKGVPYPPEWEPKEEPVVELSPPTRVPDHIEVNGEELVPGVWVYKNVFKNPEKTINLINALFGHLFSDALVYEGKDKPLDNINKKTRDCSVMGMPAAAVDSYSVDQQNLYYLIEDSMMACFADYKHQYGLGNELVGDSWQVLKYGAGQKFDSHADDGPRFPRTVSITAYLNDNYTGGELIYKHFNLTYKPEPGDVLVFPSNYIYNHQVVPVVSGLRYAIVNWFRWNTLNLDLGRPQ